MGVANITGNLLNDTGLSLSSYLPLTGGTLTGALNGTSATFSSSVTAGAMVSGITQNASNQFNAGGLTAYSNGNAFKYIQIGYDNAGNYGWIQPLEQGTAYRNLILNSAGGNVGIGTSSPYALLSVYSGSAGDRILIDSNAASGSNGAIAWGAGSLPNISARIRGIDDGGYGTHLLFETRGNGASGTTTTERMRITSGGNIIMGSTSDNNLALLEIKSPSAKYGMRIYSPNSTGNCFGLWIDAGSTSADAALLIRNYAGSSNYFFIRGDGLMVNPPLVSSFTTSSAANMYADPSNGAISRSTSSIKYKKNVEDYTKGLSQVMQLRPVSYEGKSEMDAGKTFAGFIAEEVHDLGLTEFVQYAADGSPDALAYQNMIALLTKAIQELSAKVTALENK